MAHTLDIGVDLDGVCYDFAGALRWWLHKEHRRTFATMPNPTCWEFYSEQWDMSLEEFTAACDESTNSGYLFSYGMPHPDTRRTLERLVSAGHRVHLLTDRSFGRPGKAESNTRYWLHEYKIPFTSLTFTADKTVVPVDTMIDDKVENYDALNDAGHFPFLRTRPWNEHALGRRRVASWGEFLLEVRQLASVERTA